jgi:hypothetical protein
VTQRISIQYSIDIDELGDEVERLLGNINQRITSISRHKHSNSLSLKTVEDIDSIRKELALIDLSLQDVSAIVNGYVSYRVSENTPSPTIEDDTNEDSTVSDYEVPPKEEYSF